MTTARGLLLLTTIAGALGACFPAAGPPAPAEPVRPPSGSVPAPAPAPPEGIFAGAAVSAAHAPPALHGGTLLVLADGNTALAADPDRDAVHIVDLRTEKKLATLPLQPDDEPGRAVEDAAGRVHLLLRRGGATVTIDPRARMVIDRRAVCAAPRGIAYEAATDRLHIACAGGELLALPASGGAALWTVRLDRDLRDVVVGGNKLLVSRFRSAELIVGAAQDGAVLGRQRPPGSKLSLLPPSPQGGPFGPPPPVPPPPSATPPLPAPATSATPGVAWRLRPLPGGGALMLHQEASNGELGTEGGGYGGGPCKTPVAAAFTRFEADGRARTSGQIAFAVLPIDFALSADGKRIALIAAGNGTGRTALGDTQVQIFATDQLDSEGCVFRPTPDPGAEVIEMRQPVGQVVAVAFDGQGRLVVQTREPARLAIVTHRGGTIALAEDSRFDTGHAIFHAATGAGLACASCHPEGGEDGHVWRFAKLGPRRTQTLRGGVGATAPFHWDGDLRTLDDLMASVWKERMGGPALPAGHVMAMGAWLERQPALPAVAPADGGAVERGRRLFADTQVGCATCHSGALFTNNLNLPVATGGGALQVPSLRGVGWRAPFMHDGCAATLADRFGRACGGDQHGATAQLAPAELADLVAFLESL